MNSNTLVQHSLVGQPYGFSATDLSDLGATEYTLVTIAVDASGSTASFKNKMEQCIKEAINSCKYSPRSDYLMVRLISFNHKMTEIHGFKQLSDCVLSDYDNFLNPSGSTLLFETVVNAINATNAYGEELSKNDYGANAIIIIITDGMDNESGNIDANKVGEALNKAMMDEHLESVMSILVGVGTNANNGVSQYLDDLKNQAGFTQYIEIDNATEKAFARLNNFISKSISSQSSSLGTGGPSQPLQF